MNSIVKQGQGFLDKVVELTGNYENAIAVAIENGCSITDTVLVGDVITSSIATDRPRVSFFKENTPATKLIANEIEPQKEEVKKMVFTYAFPIIM